MAWPPLMALPQHSAHVAKGLLWAIALMCRKRQSCRAPFSTISPMAAISLGGRHRPIAL